MRPFLQMDQEIVGDLDDAGCYPGLLAVNEVLTEYGILDEDDRRDARRLLRCLGSGRAEALGEEL